MQSPFLIALLLSVTVVAAKIVGKRRFGLSPRDMAASVCHDECEPQSLCMEKCMKKYRLHENALLAAGGQRRELDETKTKLEARRQAQLNLENVTCMKKCLENNGSQKSCVDECAAKNYERQSQLKQENGMVLSTEREAKEVAFEKA